MKAIKVIKDKTVNVRVSGMIKNELKKEGSSVQKFLDEKLAEKYETIITIRGKK
jgi:nitrogen regulatory protein PII-like uncharacterized protein